MGPVILTILYLLVRLENRQVLEIYNVHIPNGSGSCHLILYSELHARMAVGHLSVPSLSHSWWFL